MNKKVISQVDTENHLLDPNRLRFQESGISSKGNLYLRRFVEYHGVRNIPKGTKQTKSLIVVKPTKDSFRVLERISRANRSPLLVDTTNIGSNWNFQHSSLITAVEATKNFKNLFSEAYGEVDETKSWDWNIREKAFPWASQVFDSRYNMGHLSLKNSALRSSNLDEFIVRLLGKKSLRKDVKRAVIESSGTDSFQQAEALNTLSSTSSFLSAEIIRDYLALQSAYSGFGATLSKKKIEPSIMARFSTTQLKRFLLEGARYDRTFQDSIIMMRDIAMFDPMFNVHNIGTNAPKNVHDFLVGVQRNMVRPLAKTKIRKVKRSASIMTLLNSKTAFGLKLEVSSDPGTLSAWGVEMGNCIYSYVNSPHSMVGVYEGDKLIANLDLSETKNEKDEPTVEVHQCLGKHNKSLSEDKRDNIYKAIKELMPERELETSGAWV